MVPEMTEMLGLAHKGYKTAITNMFKDLKENIMITRWHNDEQMGDTQQKERNYFSKKPTRNSRTEKYGICIRAQQRKISVN